MSSLVLVWKSDYFPTWTNIPKQGEFLACLFLFGWLSCFITIIFNRSHILIITAGIIFSLFTGYGSIDVTAVTFSAEALDFYRQLWEQGFKSTRGRVWLHLRWQHSLLHRLVYGILLSRFVSRPFSEFLDCAELHITLC